MMMSVLQALVGLAGLIGSVVLTLGLANDKPLKASSTSAVPERAFVVLIDDVPGAGLPEEQDRDERVVAEVERPSTSWQETLANVPAEPDKDGADVLRICRVTAYCDRGTTACGVPSGLGQCAAPADIPFGSKVYIPALDKTFVVTDRTHRRFRRSTVDIFLPEKKQCRNFGRRFLECEFTLPESAGDRP